METKITAGKGVSFQFKNVWYKLYYEESTELKGEKEPGDEKKELWNTVTEQLNKEIADIVSAKEGGK